MQAKNERFEMRWDQALTDRLDGWRGSQPGIPSRAEAVRQLVERGLDLNERPPFSDSDKLIIRMLCDLLKSQKTKGELDPDFIADALLGGHNWALRWHYSGIFHRHVDDEHMVNDVVNILDMWSFIEEGHAALNKTDKLQVEMEANRFSDEVKFPGFDGNNETNYLSICHFMIEKLDRFTRFAKRDLNSHHPTIANYSRMYAIFDPIRATLVGKKLSADQIVKILNAGWPT